MHIVIMGCGRVGSTLAHTLEARGHAVAVVDQDADAFRRLGSEFTGLTVTGIGFDRDVLITAGIEHADGFASLTNGDNRNIMAAQIAREVFHVPKVITRIYDPIRQDVYQELGLNTICPTLAGARQIHAMLKGN